MFCQKCATQLPDNSVACYRCGFQFIQKVQPIQNPPSETKQPQVIIRQSSGIGAVVAFVFLLGCLTVVGVIGFFLYQKYEREKNTIWLGWRSQPSNDTRPQTVRSQNQTTTSTPTVQNSDAGYCEVNETANLKQNCDSLDCDTDPETVVKKVYRGEQFARSAESDYESANGYDWIAVESGGNIFYLASSKISCY